MPVVWGEKKKPVKVQQDRAVTMGRLWQDTGGGCYKILFMSKVKQQPAHTAVCNISLNQKDQ